MRVSVIIATYNAERTLEQCLDSILVQLGVEVEIIVIDGASTDATVEILKSYSDHLAYWDSQPDEGIYSAWNKGLKHAAGDWICFLGADDYLWEPNVISQMRPHLYSAMVNGCRVVYGKCVVVDGNGRVVRVLGSPWEKVKHRFRRELTICHAGTFHRADLFAEHGGFDESFRIVGDYDMLLRELPHRDAVFVEEVCVLAFREGGVSTRPDAVANALRELMRLRRKHEIKPYTYSAVALKGVLAVVGASMFSRKGFGVLKSTYRVGRALSKRAAGGVVKLVCHKSNNARS